MKEHDDLGVAAVNHFGSIKSAIASLEDCYHGEWDSELDFATQLFDDIYIHEIPESLQCYINYEIFVVISSSTIIYL